VDSTRLGMARPTKSAKDRTPFAQRLETTRLRTGLSMEDFASAVGLKAERYRRYERGETEPNIQTLTKIRQLTKINLNFLVAGEPDIVVDAPHRNVGKAKKAG
jgi:transcriptional regulator with XRE-family HTH domain